MAKRSTSATVGRLPEQFISTVESIADGVLAYDRTGKILYINSAARVLLGMDAVPASDVAALPPAERAARYRLRDTSGRVLLPEEFPLSRVLAGEIIKGTPSDEFVMNTLAGNEITISLSGMPTYDAMGEIDGGIIVYHDITPQKQVEQTLRDNEQRLQHILTHVPVGLVCTSLDGHYLSFNQQFCDIVGYTAAEMAQMTVADISHPADVARSYGSMQATADQRTSRLLLEKQYIHKDGHVVWVYINSSLIHKEDGTPEYFLSIVEDLTVRRAQEAQQRAMVDAEAHLALLQRVIDQLPNAAYLVRGADARLVLANAATAVVWNGIWEVGMSLPEFATATGTRVCWPDGRPQAMTELATIQVARTGVAVTQRQQVIRHADGMQLPILINAVPFDGEMLGWRDAQGQPEQGALITLQDVTAMEDAERVKSEFLAMAAHELRTPIGVVSGYVQLLAQTLPDSEVSTEQREILSAIHIASGRLAQLANDLLDVTRLEAGHLPLKLTEVDLVTLAAHMVARVRVTAPGHVLRVRAPAKALHVSGDVMRLEQVITNLLSNAVKYSPAGGEVVVTLMGSVRRGQAVLAVRDHGIGIPPAEQARIFGRFARAENAMAEGIMGTGLGLYLCRELMERQGGRIWFTSRLGQGTTFFIALPLATAAVPYEAVKAGAGTK